jgi:hypothetical protein
MNGLFAPNNPGSQEREDIPVFIHPCPAHLIWYTWIILLTLEQTKIECHWNKDPSNKVRPWALWITVSNLYFQRFHTSHPSQEATLHSSKGLHRTRPMDGQGSKQLAEKEDSNYHQRRQNERHLWSLQDYTKEITEM